jgi:SAM-dependent methyltransferase
VQYGAVGSDIRDLLTRSARTLLPKQAQRSLLLAYGVNRPYLHLPELPSRRWLQTEIMPWLRERCRSVLFVGTASYTWQYEDLFAAESYTTLDIAPAAAVWGAAHHIVAPVQELTRHRPPGSFDGVILNGVLGFGIDTPREMRRAFEELHRALRPGGLLVVGWNTDRHEDPEELGVYAGFERSGERRSFPGETHVYDVLVSSRPAASTDR